MAYTKSQFRRYLVRRHHLTDDTALPGLDEIPALVQSLGCIQYDPLDPVGRNADLVLQSRFPKYKKGDLSAYLYEQRLLFDVWDKNMAIAHVADWPYYARTRAVYEPYAAQYRDHVAHAQRALDSAESLSSADLAFAAEEIDAPWMYGKNSASKSILELMFFSGRAAVHSKSGSRRFFCATEKHIPAEHLETPDPNTTDAEFYNWFVLRRIQSVGALPARASDAFLGLIDRFKAKDRERAFSSLLESERITEIDVAGLAEPLYIPTENINMLIGADLPVKNKAARFIAPLDNLIWDRRLIADLFDFDYRWEVYVPAAKRKYGYYVLPVLCNDAFTARIELATDNAKETLLVRGFWPEPTFKKAHRSMVLRALERFKLYNRCRDIEYLCEV